MESVQRERLETEVLQKLRSDALYANEVEERARAARTLLEHLSRARTQDYDERMDELDRRHARLARHTHSAVVP